MIALGKIKSSVNGYSVIEHTTSGSYPYMGEFRVYSEEGGAAAGHRAVLA